MDPRELLYELRGVPETCSYCKRSFPADDLVPDEGGLWSCHQCIKDWEAEHGVHWEDGSPL